MKKKKALTLYLFLFVVRPSDSIKANSLLESMWLLFCRYIFFVMKFIYNAANNQ